MDLLAVTGRFRSHRNAILGISTQLFSHSPENASRVLPQLERLLDGLNSDLDLLRLLTRPVLWPTDLGTVARTLVQGLMKKFGLEEPPEVNLPEKTSLVLTDRERVVALVEHLMTLPTQPHGRPLRLSAIDREGRPWLILSTMPLGAGVRPPRLVSRGDSQAVVLTRADLDAALKACFVESLSPGGRLELAFTPAPDLPPEGIRLDSSVLALESALDKIRDAISVLQHVADMMRCGGVVLSQKDTLAAIRKCLDNGAGDLKEAVLALEAGPQKVPTMVSLSDTAHRAIVSLKATLREAQVRCTIEPQPQLPQAWMDPNEAHGLIQGLVLKSLSRVRGATEIRLYLKWPVTEAQFYLETRELRSGGSGSKSLCWAKFDDVVAKGLSELLPNYTTLEAPVQEMLRVYKCKLLSGQDGDLGLLNLALEQQSLLLLDRCGFPEILCEPARKLPWQPGQMYRLEPDFEQEVARGWDPFPIQKLEPLCARLARGEGDRPGYLDAAVIFWLFGREWIFQRWKGTNPLGIVGIDVPGLSTLGATLTRLARNVDPPQYIQRLLFRAFALFANMGIQGKDDGDPNDRLETDGASR